MYISFDVQMVLLISIGCTNDINRRISDHNSHKVHYTKEFDVILLDMNFSAGVNTGNEGIYWLSRILKSDPLASVVMITAYSDVNLAVRAIKEGATDFVVKPWDNNKLISTLQAAFKLRQTKIENKKLRERQRQINKGFFKQDCPLIGKSQSMENVLQVIKKVARTDANVLVIGENGTGKELKTESFLIL